MLRPELTDLLIVFVVALVLFGANRLPGVARGIATAIKEFRNAVADEEIERRGNEPTPDKSDSDCENQ